MPIFARPIVAIIFGAFFVCGETCDHIGDIVAPSAWTDLPLNDWFAGAFLVYGGMALGEIRCAGEPCKQRRGGSCAVCSCPRSSRIGRNRVRGSLRAMSGFQRARLSRFSLCYLS
jgi:hypothetical protein